MLQGMIRPLEETLIQVAAERDKWKIQANSYRLRVIELEERLDDIRRLTDVSL